MITLLFIYVFLVVFHYGLSCYLSWLLEVDHNELYDIGMALVWPIALASGILFFIPVLVTILLRKRGVKDESGI